MSLIESLASSTAKYVGFRRHFHDTDSQILTFIIHLWLKKKNRISMVVEDSGKNHVNFKDSNGVFLGTHTGSVWRKSFGHETVGGSYNTVNREVPSSPDPLHNRYKSSLVIGSLKCHWYRRLKQQGK
ncbi:hypothetical protein CR513_36606, partial [Mucuna pruriens]